MRITIILVIMMIMFTGCTEERDRHAFDDDADYGHVSGYLTDDNIGNTYCDYIVNVIGDWPRDCPITEEADPNLLSIFNANAPVYYEDERIDYVRCTKYRIRIDGYDGLWDITCEWALIKYGRACLTIHGHATQS